MFNFNINGLIIMTHILGAQQVGLETFRVF